MLLTFSLSAQGFRAMPLDKGSSTPYTGIMMDEETSNAVYDMALTNASRGLTIHSLQTSLDIQANNTKLAEDAYSASAKENLVLKKDLGNAKSRAYLMGIGAFILGGVIVYKYDRR